MERADGELKGYRTKDGHSFKTRIDIGELDTSLYTLKHLEMAETRFVDGKNKSIQTALNATKSFADKIKKTTVRKTIREQLDDDLSGVDLKKYGINKELYGDQRLAMICRNIKEYEAVYNHDTPFEKSSIAQLAKLVIKMDEVESSLLNSNDPKLIKQLKDLRDTFSNIAADLKVRPKDKKELDKTKGRTTLSEIVLRYEARKRSGRLEVTDKTREMAALLSKERASSMDKQFEDKG